MSYRIGAHRPRPKVRNLQTINTPNKFYLTNGSISNFALPCWYKEVRKPVKVDKHHVPNCEDFDRKKGICELYHRPHHVAPIRCRKCHIYLDMSKLIPIHLLDENEYGEDAEINVKFEQKDGQPKLPGLTCVEAYIDDSAKQGRYTDDNIIRVTLSAQCPSAQLEEQETHFTITISSDTLGKKDVVAVGKIIVKPAIL